MDYLPIPGTEGSGSVERHILMFEAHTTGAMRGVAEFSSFMRQQSRLIENEVTRIESSLRRLGTASMGNVRRPSIVEGVFREIPADVQRQLGAGQALGAGFGAGAQGFFGTGIGGVVGYAAQWMAIYGGIQQVERALASVVDRTRDLNREQTQYRIEAGKTVEEAERFMDLNEQMAREVRLPVTATTDTTMLAERVGLPQFAMPALQLQRAYGIEGADAIQGFLSLYRTFPNATPTEIGNMFAGVYQRSGFATPGTAFDMFATAAPQALRYNMGLNEYGSLISAVGLSQPGRDTGTLDRLIRRLEDIYTNPEIMSRVERQIGPVMSYQNGEFERRSLYDILASLAKLPDQKEASSWAELLPRELGQAYIDIVPLLLDAVRSQLGVNVSGDLGANADIAKGSFAAAESDLTRAWESLVRSIQADTTIINFLERLASAIDDLAIATANGAGPIAMVVDFVKFLDDPVGYLKSNKSRTTGGAPELIEPGMGLDDWDSLFFGRPSGNGRGFSRLSTGPSLRSRLLKAFGEGDDGGGGFYYDGSGGSTMTPATYQIIADVLQQTGRTIPGFTDPFIGGATGSIDQYGKWYVQQMQRRQEQTTRGPVLPPGMYDMPANGPGGVVGSAPAPPPGNAWTSGFAWGQSNAPVATPAPFGGLRTTAWPAPPPVPFGPQGVTPFEMAWLQNQMSPSAFGGAFGYAYPGGSPVFQGGGAVARPAGYGQVTPFEMGWLQNQMFPAQRSSAIPSWMTGVSNWLSGIFDDSIFSGYDVDKHGVGAWKDIFGRKGLAGGAMPMYSDSGDNPFDAFAQYMVRMMERAIETSVSGGGSRGNFLTAPYYDFMDTYGAAAGAASRSSLRPLMAQETMSLPQGITLEDVMRFYGQAEAEIKAGVPSPDGSERYMYDKEFYEGTQQILVETFEGAAYVVDANVNIMARAFQFAAASAQGFAASLPTIQFTNLTGQFLTGMQGRVDTQDTQLDRIFKDLGYSPKQAAQAKGDVAKRLYINPETGEYTEAKGSLSALTAGMQVATAGFSDLNSAQKKYASELEKERNRLASAFEGFLSRGLQPTEVTSLQFAQSRVGMYEDQRDEPVRRARSIINKLNAGMVSQTQQGVFKPIDFTPDEYALLNDPTFQGFFPGVLGNAGQVKEGDELHDKRTALLAAFEKQFYNFQIPGMYNYDALTREYMDFVGAEQGKANFEKTAPQEILSRLPEGFDRSYIQAFIDQQNEAPIVQYLSGGKSREELSKDLSDITVGAIGQTGSDLKTYAADEANMQAYIDVGTSMGEYIFKGILDAIETRNLISAIAQIVMDQIADAWEKKKR